MEKEITDHFFKEIDLLIEQLDKDDFDLELFKRAYSIVAFIQGEEWANQYLLRKYGFLTGLDDFWYTYVRNYRNKEKLLETNFHKVVGAFTGALGGVKMKVTKNKNNAEFKVQLKKELKQELKTELKEELLNELKLK